MNAQAEQMAPPFVAKGYALLVLTQKNFLGWTEDDVARLMDVTLPEVAATPGIDAARPLLFGYSAGGQAALNLYVATPGRFGGLVLDAAYPVLQEGEGRMSILSPPDAPDAANVPLFVIVGSKDGGAPVWQKAEEAWRKAGVPLVLHYVPGKGHTWLFGQSQTAALLKWLGQVSAGEKPSETVGAQAVQKIEPGAPI
jgi:pimeloyl-ACP methyl ester carboxylesterase